MARDLLREAEELERRLSALGIQPAAPGAPAPADVAPRDPPPPDEVARGIEQIRSLVEALAELQTRMREFRTLKERLDRPRPRAPER